MSIQRDCRICGSLFVWFRQPVVIVPVPQCPELWSFSAPNPDHTEENKKNQKKYLWFGYGNYSRTDALSPLNPGHMRAATNIVDKLFELFGAKGKTKEKPDETDRQ